MPRVSFFFSSRRRHTRLSRDWSSDVCSSDLTSAVRHARDTSEDHALAVVSRAQVLGRDQHHHDTRNFTHSTDDRHTSHLVLNKFIGKRRNTFLEQRLHIFYFELHYVKR